MKYLLPLALPVLAIAAGAAAQVPVSQSPVIAYGNAEARGIDTQLRSVEGYTNRGTLETPTMRRIKLQRALALRDEVAVLKAREGGTLSPRSIAYIRRKSQAILSYQR